MGRRTNNPLGKKFGNLEVLEEFSFPLPKQDGRHKTKLKLRCRCKCGRIIEPWKYNVTTGKTKGCINCANFDDLTGKTFGKIKILGLSAERTNSRVLKYNCVCECGEELVRTSRSFKVSKNPMCKKCLHPKSFLPKPIPMTNKEVMQLLANEKHEKAKKRLEGIKIGRLKVIKFDYWRYTDKRRYAYYKVKCKCGNVKSVKLDSLSVIKSCGCLQKEMQRLPGKQKNCLVTMDEAKTIRKLKKSGMYLQKEIAKMFNIPDTTVSLIILNKSYRETTASDTPKQ